jgi:hypothetical protein
LDIINIISLWTLGTKLLWDCQGILDGASMKWLHNFFAWGPYSTHLICGTSWMMQIALTLSNLALHPLMPSTWKMIQRMQLNKEFKIFVKHKIPIQMMHGFLTHP